MPPEAPSNAGRVLYLVAGDPFDPREGMDLVAQIHLRQLTRVAAVDVIATHHSRQPDPAKDADGADRPASIETFVADAANGASRWHKLAFVLSGGFLPSYGFLSSKARQTIARRLAERPQTIIVDHLHATANISFSALRAAQARGSRVVFISHDFTYDVMMDLAEAEHSRLRRAYAHTRARQALRRERELARIADCVVNISSYDLGRAREHFGSDAAKSRAILPIPAQAEPLDVIAQERRDFLIFVGSPSHMPNRRALEWIAGEFAPALVRDGKPISILLAGKGTEAYSDAKNGVEGLGFVSNTRLDELLRTAAGLLCPIDHGSGIKIKLLDALARGCPVMANAFSLRGYEDLAIEPLLRTDDAVGSAQNLRALLDDPAAWRARNEAIRIRYAALADGDNETLGTLVAGMNAQSFL